MESFCRFKIPQGVRGVIYSFLDFKSLLNTISKLSKKERKFIKNTDVLDQRRALKLILNSDSEHPIDLLQLEYTLKLCTSIHFHFIKLSNLEMSVIKLAFVKFPSKVSKSIYVSINLENQVDNDLL